MLMHEPRLLLWKFVLGRSAHVALTRGLIAVCEPVRIARRYQALVFNAFAGESDALKCNIELQFDRDDSTVK